VFNQALGTLTGVQLTVKALNSTTSITGSHNHNVNPPSVTVSGSSGSLNVSNFNSQGTTGHIHSANINGGSANGLTIPSFSFPTGSTSSHSHFLNPPIISGGPNWNLPNMLSSVTGSHSHSFGTQTNVLNYAGAGLNPFLGASDFSIGVGTSSTNTTGSHTHGFDPPATTTTGGILGINLTVNVPQTTSASNGNHSHTLTPNLQTTTVFTYTPIPEPTTWLLAMLGSACVFASRRKTQRSQR
jgi:hypothetical protein